MTDLHNALKTDEIANVANGGIQYKHVRLRQGKDDVLETLHAVPSTYTTSGVQRTDLLALAGFQRSACVFHRSECYARVIPEGVPLQDIAEALSTSYSQLDEADSHLSACGLPIPQPEGWGFFNGEASRGRVPSPDYRGGDGHHASKSETLKSTADEHFRYVLTWLEDPGFKGWTFHYRGKHMPLSVEFDAALRFLGGLTVFSDCPEFDFEACWWRFVSHRRTSDSYFDSNAHDVHSQYDAHEQHFSPGIENLLKTHATLHQHSLTLLPVGGLGERGSVVRGTRATSPHERMGHQAAELLPDKFDVALSFSGTERPLAETLATIVRDKGFEVFYDDFYPEQLWGKHLTEFFDRIYRKLSRYCVMFVSAEYAQRPWTTFERRSAVARALEDKGEDYILPVRVDDTDLDGLPPSIGYLPLSKYNIEEIADFLMRKLRTTTSE